MYEKKIIQDLYVEKTKNDPNSKTLANALDMITKTVFEDSNRFIFELIQNADDSPIKSGVANINVEIKLLEKYLIFSHTGKHFTKEDVKGISDLGSGDSGKTKDIEKTGYKGIGFKSIFNTCDLVYILSNNFTFKFDKNHDRWRVTQNYPWQIIPIWFEETELDNEIRNEINRLNVITIVPINNREQIKKEILEVFGDSRIMLFLRHISELSFFDGSVQKIRLTREQDDDGLKSIFVNGLRKSRWLYKEFTVPVDTDLKQKIKHLDKATYPDKLKEATNIKISFAAPVVGDDIEEITDALIYCYLPTKVQCNFNFLINGDFITNAERTRILENDWNGFIFKHIAICKIKWLAELVVDSKYKYQFTKLIRGKFSSVGSLTSKSYNEGLDSAIAEIPFIPVQDYENVFSKISDCIIDNTGFSEEFGTELILSRCTVKNYVADYKIQNPSMLAGLGAEIVDKKELCGLFLTETFKKMVNSDVQYNIRLIKFLHQKDNKSGWSTYLKSVPFLLDEVQQLSPPENLYYPLPEGETEISNVVCMKCLDIQVFENIKSDDKLIMWLTSLGIREPSELDILRKSIFQMIDADLVKMSNALLIGRFVYRIFDKGILNENDCKKLSNLKLVTTKGSLQLPSRCYLSDYFKPDLNLESFFTEGEYVSPQYTEEIREVSGYKKMFIRFGVQQKIRVLIEERIERPQFERKYPDVQSYLNFLDNGDFYPQQTKTYRYTSQHGLKNFVYVQYLEYSRYFKFSLKLWEIILGSSWKEICSKSSSSKYFTYFGDCNLDSNSYIQYYVKNNPSIPSDDGQCYKSIDLYSRSLKKIVGDFFPVVHKDISLNKEQEEFLAIKTMVTTHDCIFLLEKLEDISLNSSTLKTIDSIYKQIINNKPVNDNNLRFNSLKLLATDDSFQFVSELHFFDVKGLMPPSNSKYFIKISGSRKENKILFDYFDIPVIRDEDLRLNATGTESDEKLKKKLLQKLKYLAMLIANIKAEDPMEVLYKLTRTIIDANFFKAESLSLLLINKSSIEIYNQTIDSWYHADSNSVYYAGSLNNPLTLYNLSNSLSSLFEMRGNDREIHLILQLTDIDTEKWFRSIGYSVIDIEPVESEISIEKEDPKFADYDNHEDPEVGEDSFLEYINQSDVEDNLPSAFNNTQNIRKQNFYYENNHDELYSVSKKGNTEFREIGSNFNSSKSTLSIDNFGSGNQRKRLISYVSSEENKISSQINMNERRSQYQTAAIDAVIHYEITKGRRPNQTSEIGKCYDVISYNGEVEEVNRYIIVFGFIGEWNNYEVFFSNEQMKFTKEKEDQLWLYVVEFVEDEQHLRINRIQNLYSKITSYVFDYGWRVMAEKDNLLEKFVAGVRINHHIHGLGIIKEEINKGKMKFLIVDFENDEKRIPINITQIDILED
ncbi:hypothetical protein J2T13_002754 [Paenibacillus sp. DS2015]|uniref:sacsin N-terminal ATP-binding-like domain-containing protein n=1 Tax=Paenibacillus sp. DS2015 TaxID=3373917 RepID=UPI003D1ECED3